MKRQKNFIIYIKDKRYGNKNFEKLLFCVSVIVDKIKILFIERYYIKIIDTYRINQKIVCTINRISNKITG